MDTSGHKTKRYHMDGPSAHVGLDHNSSPYDFLNSMMGEESRSGIFQEFTNMISTMEGAGRKGDQNRKSM